jgi:paraquat-inducible protein B
MAKPVNRKLIGGFVVLAVGIMAASVVIFGSGQYFKKTEEYVLYFEEPVKGLNIGAPALFRGVQVGQVKNIILRAEVKEFKFHTAVFIEVYPERFEFVGAGTEILDPKRRVPILIERGLRAQLVSLSLITGQLGIQVDFYPGTPAVSRKVAMDAKYTEIPTIPSTLAQLEKGMEKLDVEELGAHLKSILAAADRLVNSPDLTAGIHEFKGAMQDARGLLQNANAKVNTLTDNLNGQVRPLSESMQATLSKAQKAIDDADKLVRDVDDQVKPLSGSVQATLSDAQKAIDLASQDFHALSGDAEKVLKDLDSHIVPMLDQARNTLVNVDNFIGEDSDTRYKLNQALDAIAAASKSLGSLMDYLQQHPEGLLKGKGGK